MVTHNIVLCLPLEVLVVRPVRPLGNIRLVRKYPGRHDPKSGKNERKLAILDHFLKEHTINQTEDKVTMWKTDETMHDTGIPWPRSRLVYWMSATQGTAAESR